MTEYRWPDLFLGLKHGFEANFTAEMAAAFAALSGDTNPLHVDSDYAVNAGFAGPVLFGMLTSALYSRLVGLYLPGKFARLEGIDIDFHGPCYADELLWVEGEVSFLNDAFRRFEVKASIRKPDRKLVSKAMIRVGFHAG